VWMRTKWPRWQITSSIGSASRRLRHTGGEPPAARSSGFAQWVPNDAVVGTEVLAGPAVGGVGVHRHACPGEHGRVRVRRPSEDVGPAGHTDDGERGPQQHRGGQQQGRRPAHRRHRSIPPFSRPGPSRGRGPSMSRRR
jgi:hypothetical protein